MSAIFHLRRAWPLLTKSSLLYYKTIQVVFLRFETSLSHPPSLCGSLMTYVMPFFASRASFECTYIEVHHIIHQIIIDRHRIFSWSGSFHLSFQEYISSSFCRVYYVGNKIVACNCKRTKMEFPFVMFVEINRYRLSLTVLYFYFLRIYYIFIFHSQLLIQ